MESRVAAGAAPAFPLSQPGGTSTLWKRLPSRRPLCEWTPMRVRGGSAPPGGGGQNGQDLADGDDSGGAARGDRLSGRVGSQSASGILRRRFGAGAASEATETLSCLFAAVGPDMAAGVVNKPPGTSSRILLDIPCKVCLDHSSGKHYGIFACDGCAGFFKRSIRRNRQYVCKARGAAANGCPVDKTHRNQCRSCRLRKCLEAGMNKEAVQHERGPRNSTLRRQVALYLKEATSAGLRPQGLGGPGPSPVPGGALQPPMPGSHGAPGGFGLHPAFLGPDGACAAALYQSSIRAPLSTTAGLCHPTPKYPHEMLAAYPETICESAARLLFMNVKWMKTVTALTVLPMRDQLLLLEEGWRELFVLSAAQFLLPLEVAPLLAAAGLTSEPSTSERVVSLLAEIRNFQEIITKFKEMQVDPTEYACVKAILLFKTSFQGQPSETRTLRDVHAAAALQDQAQLTLSKYIQTAYPTQPFRFGKLLLSLPSLRTVSAVAIEDLFFRRTIGAIPIERLLCDMYKSGDF